CGRIGLSLGVGAGRCALTLLRLTLGRSAWPGVGAGRRARPCIRTLRCRTSLITALLGRLCGGRLLLLLRLLFGLTRLVAPATAATITHALCRRQTDAGEQRCCGQQEPARSNAVHVNLRLLAAFFRRGTFELRSSKLVMSDGPAANERSSEFPVCRENEAPMP